MRRTLLRGLSASAILGSVCDAAERWSDADFPPRVRATQAIRDRLGFSEPVIDYALDRLFMGIRRGALEATIADELGTLAALDGPVPLPGRPVAFARGVDRVVIVSSDSTIGVAIVPAIFALCAKCNVLVKDRSDALVSAFFASLVEERPEFADAAIARAWTGGSDAGEATLFAEADVVVAFGAEPALRAIRDQLGVETRFVPFGHRATVGYVDATATPARPTLLDAIAADALLYDGSGCLSLHALFVAGSEAPAFVAELAAAFDRVGVEFPPGSSDPQRAASAAAYRNLGTFRAAGGHGAVFAPARAAATIAFNPPRDAPPPFLARVLPVFAIESPADVRAYVDAHRLPIAALGVTSSADPAMLALAEAIGAVRVAPFGQLQSPPLGGHHGGAARIADFIRWIDCA